MMKRKEIEAELSRETAYSRIADGNYSAEDGIDRTKRFHLAMGMMVREEPGIPSVSERLLRARLLLEETLETIQKGLGLYIKIESHSEATGVELHDAHDNDTFITIEHQEGVKYDPLETMDGLADVKVIANGTAVQFGLPLHEAEYEVWCSNMTKLDEQGNPIVNGCITEGHEHEGRSYDLSDDCVLMDSSKPLGKVLKPDCYVPANIARIFVRFAGDENEVLNRAWLLAHGES